jgi:glycine/D-amino acid oxidase-like deaminating enzyme
VRRVTPAADRIRVELADGDMLVADWVVDCAGCAAGEVLAEQQLGLLCRDSPGLLVVTEPAATSLDRVVHTPGVYMRPEGNGRVLIGSNEIDASLADLPRGAPEPGPYAAPARELLGRAQARLPDLAGVDVESVRLCWRPMPGDDLSAVGPLAAVPGYYLALTHSGVTLAPILAESIVAEMTTGEADPLLQAFRPDRLLQRL